MTRNGTNIGRNRQRDNEEISEESEPKEEKYDYFQPRKKQHDKIVETTKQQILQKDEIEFFLEEVMMLKSLASLAQQKDFLVKLKQLGKYWNKQKQQ